MELSKVIEERRSVRHYNNKKLECLMILDTILAIKKDAITDETNTIVYFLVIRFEIIL